jgi:omega-3 fatty acid desaturase (delta-15 desaturase)
MDTANMRIAELVADTTSETPSKEGLEAKKALAIGKLRAAVPKEAFVKSLFWSMFYMVFDYTFIIASTVALYTIKNNGVYDAMPLWQQIGVTCAHWLVAGFFMWCIFVVGHDCGHSTFSDYWLVNDVIGHITHSSILVPYYPWRLSHQRHHMHHNHIDNDYSHPWITPEKIELPEYSNAKNLEENPWIRGLFPFFGWPVYLLGLPDGSHFFPFKNAPFPDQRLFGEKTPARESAKCLVSTATVAAFAITLYRALDGDLWLMFQYYYAPVLVFGWWLVCVTFLQHHEHDSVVYNDSNWSFALAAFETVDRRFGWGIDTLHHHITDGHVAHHLFFTQIPHYNLPLATAGITSYLKEQKIDCVYKFENTFDFPYRLHKYMYQFGYASTELKAGENISYTCKVDGKGKNISSTSKVIVNKRKPKLN